MLVRRIRRMLLPLAISVAVVMPLSTSHGAAAAPTLGQCSGQHQWNFPNSLTTNATQSFTETWAETCTSIDPNASPAPWATVQESPNVNANPTAFSDTYTGNCALMQITSPAFANGGFKDIIGNVEIGVGVNPNTAAPANEVMVGLLLVPSAGAVPCNTATPVTWSGVQSWVAQN